MKKELFVGVMATSLLAFEAMASDMLVKKIEVNGLQRVEKATVLSYLNIKQNSTVSQDKLDSSFKRLYDTGLFSDVNFDTSKNDTLVINVKENPVIGKRAFDGNDKIDDKILESEVQLGPR